MFRNELNCMMQTLADMYGQVTTDHERLNVIDTVNAVIRMRNKFLKESTPAIMRIEPVDEWGATASWREQWKSH